MITTPGIIPPSTGFIWPPPWPPQWLRDAIEEAVRRANRREQFENAIKFAECINNGGSIGNCLGLQPRVLQLPKPKPFFEELLSNIDSSSKKIFLTMAKEEILDWSKAVDIELAQLDGNNG